MVVIDVRLEHVARWILGKRTGVQSSVGCDQGRSERSDVHPSPHQSWAGHNRLAVVGKRCLLRDSGGAAASSGDPRTSTPLDAHEPSGPLGAPAMWLVGNALDGVGYLFQFLALRRGSLSLVEPLLVLSLVFALPVAAWLDHRRLSASEWTPTVMIAAGTGLFLRVARPGLGHPRASDLAWAILSAVMVAICAALVLGARKRSRNRSAVMQAAGSGAAFGYVAAVTERTGHLLNGGIVHTLSSWEPYALAVGGTAALLLTQGAYNAGPLRLSLPTMTVAQPFIAVAIGLAMFGERIDTHGVAPVLEVLAIVLVMAGVVAIAKSSIIAPEENLA
jgi:drug/metabolite transporter (DMT)-like permease